MPFLNRLVAVRSQLARQRLLYQEQVIACVLETELDHNGPPAALLADLRRQHDALQGAADIDAVEVPLVCDLVRIARHLPGAPADAVLETARDRFAFGAPLDRWLRERIPRVSSRLILVRGAGALDPSAQERLGEFLNAMRTQGWQSRFIVLGRGWDPGTRPALERRDVQRLLHWFSQPPSPARVDLTRLPSVGEHLVGRDDELSWLDDAWESPGTHLAVVVAWGGSGKTTLVRHWANRLREEAYRGAQRVFGWSFYHEGGDRFLVQALHFFGDAGMGSSGAAPGDKGRRLAQLVAQERALVVLDGLEPLQWASAPAPGSIKDPGVAAFLTGLADASAGLCVITTRQSIADLAAFRTTTLRERVLEGLAPEAGAVLLHRLGVQRAGGVPIAPDHPELLQASSEVKGHALTLRLMGRYLALAGGGDVGARNTFDFADVDGAAEGGHGHRVLQTYERWLLAEGDAGARPLAILRLLGLFDRPADAGCLQALRAAPAIPGLTDRLVSMDDREWNAALERLQDMALVSLGADRTVDTHLLIRAYFTTRFHGVGEAAREGHRRLYEYLAGAAPDLPETLEAMEPLFHAIRHGCAAGLHQRVHDDVFLPRVQRGEEYFSNFQLGAYGEELAALGAFFTRRWNQPVRSLTGAAKAMILHSAAFDLFRVGRLDEAVDAFKVAEDQYRRQRAFDRALMVAWALNQLYVVRGDLLEAVEHSRRMVRVADKLREPLPMTGSRIMHARARAQAGALSARAFEVSYARIVGLRDRITAFDAGDYALGVYALFDVLLYRIEAAAVTGNMPPGVLDTFVRRVDDNLASLRAIVGGGHQPVFTAAIVDLIAGQTQLVQAVHGAAAPWPDAEARLSSALDGFIRSAMHEYTAYALLFRASLRRHRARFLEAESDLRESLQVGIAAGMKPHQADCHLEQARISIATGNLADAALELDRAAQIVQTSAYHRRDAALAALRADLAAVEAI